MLCVVAAVVCPGAAMPADHAGPEWRLPVCVPVLQRGARLVRQKGPTGTLSRRL